MTALHPQQSFARLWVKKIVTLGRSSCLGFGRDAISGHYGSHNVDMVAPEPNHRLRIIRRSNVPNVPPKPEGLPSAPSDQSPKKEVRKAIDALNHLGMPSG